MLKHALFLFLLTLPFAAHAQCYTRAEAEADQGIRIHSELMVIGLNCQAIGARHGMSPYEDYRSFTADHATLFETYENIMRRFYTANQMNAKDSLNDLRTRYANAISKVVAAQRPDVFCARHIGRIAAASEMDEVKLRGWAATLYPSHPVSYPLCQG